VLFDRAFLLINIDCSKENIPFKRKRESIISDVRFEIYINKITFLGHKSMNICTEKNNCEVSKNLDTDLKIILLD